MVRSSIVAVLVGGLLATGAPLVLASSSPREPVPTGPFSIPAAPDGPCPFEIDVSIVTNREYQQVFTDASGNVSRILITGNLVWATSNADTGTTRTWEISGPATLVPNDDGTLTITARGRSILFNFNPEFALLLIGRTVVDAAVRPDGLFDFTLRSTDGQRRDLCTILA